MQSAEILDVKQFMQLLLQSSAFDHYETVSATLRTNMDYQIDGRWNKDFFSDEDMETYNLNNYTYLPWSLAKEKIFLLIKGKKTPTIMKIVFKVSRDHLNALLSTTESSIDPKDIDGIYINILFQEHKLTVTCQLSYKIFSLDKSFEEEFFTKLTNLLKSNNIASQ